MTREELVRTLTGLFAADAGFMQRFAKTWVPADGQRAPSVDIREMVALEMAVAAHRLAGCEVTDEVVQEVGVALINRVSEERMRQARLEAAAALLPEAVALLRKYVDAAQVLSLSYARDVERCDALSFEAWPLLRRAAEVLG